MEDNSNVQRDLGRIEGKLDSLAESFREFRQTILSDIVEHRVEANKSRESHELRLRSLEDWRAGVRGSWKAISAAGMCIAAVAASITTLVASHL